MTDIILRLSESSPTALLLVAAHSAYALAVYLVVWAIQSCRHQRNQEQTSDDPA